MSANMRSAARPSQERQPMDEEASPSTTRELDSKMSIDSSDAFHHPRTEAPPLVKPPVSPYPRYGQKPMPTRPVIRPLQSVVTASFSAEERDRLRAPGAREKLVYISEQRYDREERYVEDGERDDWSSPGFPRPPIARSHSRDMGPPPPPPPPPPQTNRPGQPLTVQRAYSSPAYYAQSPSMKRNYYHHSQPSELSRDLPSEFMPPKRFKPNPSHEKERIVSPSTPRHAGRGDWYPPSRTGTWDSDESSYKYIGRAHSFPVPPSWNPYNQSTSPSASMIRLPAVSDNDNPPRRWQQASQQQWSGVQSLQTAWASPKASSSEHPWNSPARSFHFSDTSATSGKMSYEAERPRLIDHHSGPGKTEASSAARNDSPGSSGSTEDNACKLEMPSGETIILLAAPQDRTALSETLCVVREVSFCAELDTFLLSFCTFPVLTMTCTSFN